TEARKDPRFIKIEQYLLNEGFSIDGTPIVHAGQRYELKDWAEKGQEPFLYQDFHQCLQQFERQPSVEIVLYKYSFPNESRTATAQYVTIPTSSGGRLVCVKANIFEAGKRIYSLLIDADQNIAKEF
ncbi:MAG: hypothetical protein VKK04_06135, partial [Synechococcales bacterium]|nr:hypothetical protein [Synechococcales bacterium]